MRVFIEAQPLSDGSTVHNVRIEDGEFYMLELAAIDEAAAERFKFGFEELIRTNTVETIQP